MRILLLLFLAGCSTAMADDQLKPCNADMGGCLSIGTAMKSASVMLFTTNLDTQKAAKLSFRNNGTELFWIDSKDKIHFHKGVTREQVARAAVNIIERNCR